MEWFYSQGDQKHGPISEDQLPQLTQSGVLTSESLVWCRGMGDWAQAGSTELASRVAAQPPPIPSYGSPLKLESSSIGPDISSQSEEMLLESAATYFRGIESVGGRLKLTTQRLLFEPHAFNVQKKPLELFVRHIARVEKTNSMLVIPNGLLIQTKGGIKYEFTTFNRNAIVSELEKLIRG